MSRYDDGKSGYVIIVSSEWLEAISKFAFKEDGEAADDVLQRYRYSAARGKVKIDVSEWSAASLKSMADFLDKKVADSDVSAKMARNILQQWIEIQNNPSGSTVSRFENLASSLRQYIATVPKRWVFEQTPDGNMVPWFVTSVLYHEPTKHSSARVTISLLAINNTGHGRDGKSCAILPGQFNKKLTMGQFLELQGLHLETEARVKSYEVEVAKYLEWYDNDGLQMSVRGKAYLDKGWSNSGFRNVGQSGRPAKMVVDPGEESEKGASSVSCSFWDKNEEVMWNIPVHPILDCFDLEEHADYRVHVNNAEVYVYDKKVGDKLVLPEDVKSFIEVLIEHSKNKFVDIVGGKEGGTIILLEGPPGTGKTLTAEVYSEVMERPLYKVQSSQLGTDPKTVEEQLKVVLQRSERWGAILLIDESDVYIHERGSDIDQNAIVGVFLRVLEYYRGVLFMTTNRGVLVDDAIISRLTARFRYIEPNKAEQTQLWRILADQNNIKLSDTEIAKIVKETPNLSGRDIKNMLKLAFVAELKTGGQITAKTVARISKFRQMPEG